MLGSLSIAVNSLTGPAMLDLPATFARSGVLPTIATLLLVCVLAAVCSLHMANSISKVPGNGNFQKQVEFSEAFSAFWGGRRWFLVTQALFWGCITCLNISSMVDTAQVVDTFVGHWWQPHGGTAAVHVVFFGSSLQQPTTTSAVVRIQWVRWDYSLCTKQELVDGLCLPFRIGVDLDGGILVTFGTILVTVLFVPLALLDLRENAWWQVVAFLILLITSVQFVVQFWQFGLEPSYLSWWGTDWDDLLGVVLFNFALVLAVPAWLYEREPHVDVPTVINASSALSVILYIAIGLLGSMAMPNVSENMLESMMSGVFGSWMQIGASIFAFAIVGLGFPLFSVLTRLNLTGSGLCSRRVGNVLAVYFPFGVSWLLNGGTGVRKLLSWGGVLFTSLVAFILPLVLALHVVKEFDYEGSVAVYCGRLRDKRSELLSLRVLLSVAVFAIVLAILGNLFDYQSY